MSTTTYDLIGIGVGPFNLGLACLTEPIDDLETLFLDQSEEFDWHAGMLLEDVTLQTPFMADLVTLADPTSPYTFLNYLKERGRLYAFYIRENFHVLRTEYNLYCRWAAERLPSVVFGNRVERVEHDPERDEYVVRSRHRVTGLVDEHRARHVVLGTGTTPYLPPSCRDVDGPAIHSSGYLDAKEQLQRGSSVTVVGSGQSAAEIFHDLLQDSARCDYLLRWVTRSPRFFPLDYTKLTLQMTSPEYVDYFYSLDAATRDTLLESQRGLYKGIDASLIDAIYDRMYAMSVTGEVRAELLTSSRVDHVHYDPVREQYTLGLHQTEQGRDHEFETDGLVLATGYGYEVPGFLDPIREQLCFDHAGRLAVQRNYGVDGTESRVFVQNAEIHTHGFTAPDLGMASYRNSCIIAAILGREYYPIERQAGFQQFGTPDTEPVLPGPA